MSRYSKASGTACIFAGHRSRWTLHYILQRTIVLNEVEVRGSDWLQGHAQIANDGYGFQENFRQEHGGSPIEIYASGMHFFHKRTKEAKVEMRGGTKGGTVD